jgi:Fur family peroxide stress response transcriptional regulator
MPSLSLATVYKALDALKTVGVVREVASFTHGRRYDANVDRHHHLVCTRCHKVADLYDARLDSVAPPRHVPGFRPRSVSVQVLGLCNRCTADGTRAARTRRRTKIRMPAGKES